MAAVVKGAVILKYFLFCPCKSHRICHLRLALLCFLSKGRKCPCLKDLFCCFGLFHSKLNTSYYHL